ncbi:alpha-L-rhamnosidase-related protein [Siphonobacter aquaeclarae]|uniref:Alpha-L-rhamnosidase n=1 Tax=Siphonobacter aquaeclarae TaxID=563176 RepID=A0A1G9IB54_9BACT|nr:alpha-L-rhamnosidase C-terminal domain-containing protein [Siphonobacter aquaeclarae]SDL22431.1 alpha-L-rhamnosidase [Siphonobacter aquaeclarae]
MTKKYLLALSLLAGEAAAQLPPVFENRVSQPVPTITRYLSPVRIVWQSGSVKNASRLLGEGNGQADLANRNMSVWKNEKGEQASVLLDFGKELHGGLQIVSGMSPSGKPVRVRIRFGESAAEAMSSIGPKQTATNDHAIRDEEVLVPWLGKLEIGNTGFRFVRVDLVEPDAEWQVKEIRAAFIFRDLAYQGSFRCSDELLNRIWMTGAYTVHLNMQDYLWDGIKRDRLVWVGDMHPETSAISAVFGHNEVVPKSLDLVRDITPLPQWMNGISTYSMWWIIIHRDWYYHNGDLAYLRQQKDYLVKLLAHLRTKIGSDHKEKLDGHRFLDWPSSENQKGVDAGLQAMLIWSLRAGADLCRILGETEAMKQSLEAVADLSTYVPDPNGSKQAAALMGLTGLLSPEKANTLLSEGGAKGYSTFYGYYMLQAKAKAGDYDGALRDIRTFWGAMLNLGATTFWEDFNLDWLPGASRIDELPAAGQKDIHGDYGAYCYVGFRHSLSHGWAAGPTPWLTEHVLGIQVLEPGCRKVKIEPHLGDLTFAEGTFPTPYGLIRVRHTRGADGKIRSEIKAPKEVKVVK